MPTKRFHKLEPDKAAHILRVAGAEFAANGFEGASYNRIIAASGVSKGAMYYYFEDKADLYQTVVRRFAGDVIAGLGRFEPAASPEAFWEQVHAKFTEAFVHSMHDPVAVGLIKSVVRDAPELGVLDKLRVQMAEWLVHLLEVGQAAGAIRTDLPNSFLIALAMGVGEAHDIWLAEHMHELPPHQLAGVLPNVIDLYQRLLRP